MHTTRVRHNETVTEKDEESNQESRFDGMLISHCDQRNVPRLG
jgi:hypothetical protein